MKRILAVLAVIASASIANANVWNVNWSLGSGYAESPTDSSHGVLEDYSVTWSLMYGDSVIDSVNSSGTSIQWTDTKYSPSFGAWLDEPTDYTTYYGDTIVTDTVLVYQRIVATDGTDTYQWESEAQSVKPVDVAKDNPAIWNVEIHSADWTKIENPTTIPEPATMSLLGLGALAMVLRRKLSK